MANINLSESADTYVQSAAEKDEWNDLHGLAGNDSFRLYQGNAHGGPGNDRIEQIVDPEAPWRNVGAAYWDAGDNLVVNLAEGWADDGLGGRDTLIGVDDVHGSGARNALVIGDAQDNTYFPNGGDDLFRGGAGDDEIYITGHFRDPTGTHREALIGELVIDVSADGRSATFTPALGPGFSYRVEDVEYFFARWKFDDVGEWGWQRFQLSDFILPQTMAEDAIAAGGVNRWNAAGALGSVATVSYSFVAQSSQPGFRAFSAAEQQLVRDILTQVAQFTLLSFTEVVEATGGTGQMRFGINRQADSKGQAHMPDSSGDAAGDVWMDVESMLGIQPGTEGYQALLHEIGHALGLRHPRNTDPGDAWTTTLREPDDRLTSSVMSETPSPDGLFRADFGPLDVLALRHLYGERELDTGDTVHRLGDAESAAITTVIDDGGIDVLDASAMPTGVTLDLRPGRASSVGFTPAGLGGVDNLGVVAGEPIEHVVGSAFDDVLIGNALDNRLTGGLGNDRTDGGEGIDTAVFAGRRADFELSNAFGTVHVAARDGVSGYDSLLRVERLAFDDQVLVLAPKVVSTDSSYGIDEDASLSAALPDPEDVPRADVAFRIVGRPAHGQATLSGDGQLVYTPSPDYAGADAVEYEIASAGASNRYLASIDVRPINDAPPVASAGAMLVAGTHKTSVQLPGATDIDGDPITYALATSARRGDVVVAADGAVSYQVRGSYTGTDSFNFIVSDGQGGTNVFPVSVTIVPVQNLIQGTSADNSMTGRSSADAYFGQNGNDRITGGGGDDLLDGGEGIDTAVYSGQRSAFTLARADHGWRVGHASGVEGTDLLTQVERLQFGNTHVALDLGGHAGSVAQIIRALFGSAVLTNKDFVGIGLSLFDAGMDYSEVVALALGTEVFAQMAGGRSHKDFVNHVYRNVIGSKPSDDELALFVGQLDAGVYTQDSLALVACQIGFNTASAELVGLANTGIEFLPAA